MHRQIVRLDRRLLAGDQIGEQLAGAARHRPAERAVARVQEQVRHRRAADDRRAVRRHRAQARPERGLRRVAAAREQIVHAHFERLAACRAQRLVEADDFRHPADADALVETRDRDLVGFVEHRRHRRGRFVDDRRSDRIALQRIDRDLHQIRDEIRRVRAERDHVRVGAHRLAAALHAGDLAARNREPVDRRVVAELHAERFGERREARREQLAVARFVTRQTQAAGELVRDGRERRFGVLQLGRRQQFERHVRFAQHRDVLRRAVELLLRAEQLQRAARAAFVLDAGVGAQRLQAVAAVFGKAHHTALVDRIALGRAVAQHLPHPLELEARAIEADRERRMLFEHPLDGLQRHAGRGPRRRIAGRDLAGIREARLERRAGFPVDHRDLMTGAREVIRACHAHHTAAQNDDSHSCSTSKKSARGRAHLRLRVTSD